MHNFYKGQAVRHFIYGDGEIREIYKNRNEETCFDVFFPRLGKTVTVMSEKALTPADCSEEKENDDEILRDIAKFIFNTSNKGLGDIALLKPTKDTTTKSEKEEVPQKMHVSKKDIDDKKKEHLQNLNKVVSCGDVKPEPNEISAPYGFHPVKEYDGVAHHLDIVMGLNKLYAQKNADYGDSFHLSYLEEGMAMARIRLSDKLNRFKALTKNGSQQVKDESIRDTLLDLANYAILTVMELDREQGGNYDG